MKLRNYLFHNNITIGEFADKLLCSRCHLSSVIWGRLKPSKRLAASIERETGGLVSVDEIQEDMPLHKKKCTCQQSEINKNSLQL